MHFSKHEASSLSASKSRPAVAPQTRPRRPGTPHPPGPPHSARPPSAPALANLHPSPRHPPEALGGSLEPGPQTRVLTVRGWAGWRSRPTLPGPTPSPTDSLPARPACGRPARSYGRSPALHAPARAGGAGPPPCRSRGADRVRRRFGGHGPRVSPRPSLLAFLRVPSAWA